MTVQPYEPIENINQWHDTYSLQLGECIENGIVDFSQPEYDFDSINAEQRNRIYDLITNHYYFYELVIMPVKIWRIELVRTLNETMLKCRRLYEMLDSGFNPLNSETEYGKKRQVFSDFPQTRLSSQNQDYASNANDTEYEIDRTGDELNRYNDYVKSWKHPDMILIESVATCFNGMISQGLNTY